MTIRQVIEAVPSLNPRHKQVADEYLKCGNATQAAVNAGYSARSAKSQGAGILGQKEVQQYLQAQREKLQDNEEDLQSRITKELIKLGFSNISDFISIDAEGNPQVNFTGATREQLAAVTSVKTKRRSHYVKGELQSIEQDVSFNLADKHRSLETLAKITGLLKHDETRVIVDVADRLLKARSRVLALPSPNSDVDFSDSSGGAGGAGV